MMKIIKPKSKMEPVIGTIREGLHAMLDDLMNDIEKQSGVAVGGVSQTCADAGRYRHKLTLSVSVVTEPASDPNSN